MLPSPDKRRYLARPLPLTLREGSPEWFQTARAVFGLDQHQMALLLGYGSQTALSRLENGKLEPRMATILLMRAYLDGYRPLRWPGFT